MYYQGASDGEAIDQRYNDVVAIPDDEGSVDWRSESQTLNYVGMRFRRRYKTEHDLFRRLESHKGYMDFGLSQLVVLLGAH